MKGCLSLLAASALAALASAYNECPDPSSNPFPLASRGRETTVEHANYFTIDYVDDYKIVTNLDTKRRYILYPCGAASPPTVTAVDDYTDRFFEVPLKKVAIGDTTVLGALKRLNYMGSSLGVLDRLVSLTQYAVDTCFLKAAACATNEYSSSSTTDATIENFASATTFDTMMTEIDAYFTWDDDGVIYNNVSPYEFTYTDVTKTITYRATKEHSLLGQAEWIKYAAAFFNLEVEADRAFHEIKHNYHMASRAGRAQTERPLVAFASYYCKGGLSPCADTETFYLNVHPMKISMVSDAGGRVRDLTDSLYRGVGHDGYTLKWVSLPGTDSNYTAYQDYNQRRFLKAIEDVDILFDDTYYYDPSTATLSAILTQYGLSSGDTQYKFIDNNAVYRTDKISAKVQGTSDWLESGAVNVGLSMIDLVKVVHADADDPPLSDLDRTYIRKLSTESATLNEDTDCSDTYAICDATVSSYPILDICDRSSFKMCPDDIPVFLDPENGCSAMMKCPPHILTAGEKAAIGVLVPVGFILLVIACVWCCCKRKKSSGGQQVAHTEHQQRAVV